MLLLAWAGRFFKLTRTAFKNKYNTTYWVSKATTHIYPSNLSTFPTLVLEADGVSRQQDWNATDLDLAENPRCLQIEVSYQHTN